MIALRGGDVLCESSKAQLSSRSIQTSTGRHHPAGGACQARASDEVSIADDIESVRAVVML